MAYAKKNFKAAIRELDQALRVAPDNAICLALRAMAHYAVKRYSAAHADLNAALQRDPTNKEAIEFRKAMRAEAVQCRDRAKELGKVEKTKRSLDELNTAVQLEPDNPYNFFLRGMTYSHMGDFKAAVIDMKRALELDPNDADAKKVLPLLLEQLPQGEKASRQPSSNKPSCGHASVAEGLDAGCSECASRALQEAIRRTK